MRKPVEKLYWVWADMLSRCRNPNHKAFVNYGGRGITFDPTWANYQTFREWALGSGYALGLSLDRRDNDGSYGPGNCRWATRKEQNSNRRNCIFVAHGSERVTLREYCRREGLTYRPIVKRIQTRGWPIERALNTPIGAA